MTAPNLDLFDAPAVYPPMTRAGDHATSKAAAQKVAKGLSELESAVLAAIAAAGATGLTDREMEVLPQFAHLAPSTARRRRTSLLYADPPRVRALRRPDGTIISRDGLTVWVAV
jgi:hypothetical protein